AGIAARVGRDLIEDLIGYAKLHLAQAALGVVQRAPQERHDLVVRELIEDIDSAARKQCAVDLERRILRGGADQPDIAALDVGQKRVLLGAVEAVDFVHEENGPRAVGAGLFRVRHDLLDLLDPGEHGGKLDELRLGRVRDDLRQRGLARARRAPEDDGAGIVALDLQTQRLARPDDVLLADKLFQRARTHAVRQRPRAAVLLVRECLKQTHEKTFKNLKKPYHWPLIFRSPRSPDHVRSPDLTRAYPR